MKLNRILLILVVLLISPLTGCMPKTDTVIVPRSEITIAEATEINLKILDLTKMTTGETDEVLGFPVVQDIEGARVIEYRYPSKPIKVKVIKFKDELAAIEFWQEWSHYVSIEHNLKLNTSEDNEKGYWEFATPVNKILTWQQGLWLTYIEVPKELNNSEDLSYKVKDIIMHHFENLNSKIKA